MLYKNVSEKSITIKELYGHVTLLPGESKEVIIGVNHPGLLLCEVKKVKPKKSNKKASMDVNGDGKVDFKDVVAVAKKIVTKNKKSKR